MWDHYIPKKFYCIIKVTELELSDLTLCIPFHILTNTYASEIWFRFVGNIYILKCDLRLNWITFLADMEWHCYCFLSILYRAICQKRTIQKNPGTDNIYTLCHLGYPTMKSDKWQPALLRSVLLPTWGIVWLAHFLKMGALWFSKLLVLTYQTTWYYMSRRPKWKVDQYTGPTGEERMETGYSMVLLNGRPCT